VGLTLLPTSDPLPAADKPPRTAFTFRDTGDEAGLFPHVAGIAGHGVMWGDVDGTGYPSLYVGTFGAAPYDSKSNLFFRNEKGKFRLDDQKALQVTGRANGGVFADFDNTGRLDLYVTNHAIDGKPYKQPHFAAPNALFRNDGIGKFTDVSAGSGVCPTEFPSRSACVLDYDGDGKLDLLVGECFFQGGKSRSRLFRNLGGMKFEDATRAAGLPEQVTGFGVAAADVNGDGWPDIMLGGRFHGNRLFINDGKGRFKEVPSSHANFAWKYSDTQEDTPCGVCFGDVNGDGRPDIVIGQHFDRPWFTGGVPIRLYLNRGVKDGWPMFEDVTEKSGLVPLPLKAPHVEIQDIDNDGLPDILTSLVKFASGRPYPIIFKNLGVKDGLPRFEADALGVNDFPTAEDKKIADVTEFFKKAEKAGKIVYMAPGASADYDRDGRLDLFLPNWWVPQRSLLLHNETPSGHWLQVTVNGSDGVNKMGVGSVVRVYAAGKLGKDDALLGSKEIAAGYGYASGQEAVAHFGLGKQDRCDIEVILPHGKGRIEKKDVAANQRIALSK